MDCIFCKIVAGTIPAKKVFESDQVLAFEDIAKVAPVHVLVIPKRHIESVLDLSPQDAELLAALQTGITSVAQQTGVAGTGFRVVSNCGASAGQSVFHLHYHVIGGRELALSLG
ncbi:MAG: histidine triad nucleotide-binding protein [Firmicutes bacterium]|nr:histidine triad nucleotide-binding protein [Bacillota bacterium]